MRTKVRSPRRNAKHALGLLCVLVIAPTVSMAWSFFSLFGGDDDGESGSFPQDDSNELGDLSDGTDNIVTQPLLKPTDWFITEEEIVESRGGIPRDGFQTYTRGNKVTAFAGTNEFFSAIAKDLRATKEGDRVMHTGWDTCDISFEPDLDPTGITSGFNAIFKGIVERGGNVNILTWSNHLLPSHNIKARNDINEIPPSPINGAKAVYLFDDRVPLLSSSHHQKATVIVANKSTGRDDHPIAYVGGIDLSNDRWDSIYHNNSAIREAGNINFRNKGWIDAHFRIHGPAAKDVANNFIQRWNSDYEPAMGLEDDFLDFANPSYDKIPPIDYASSNTVSKLGKQNVQIVRTLSCIYKHYEEFAPRGEQSLFRARIKALKSAKNFIYIEDQYFIYVPELLDALLEVLPRIQRLIVVVQPPDLILKMPGYEKYIYEMIRPMKKKFPNKVQIYSAKTELDLYIHTKLVLIDDVYASLGSANWNRRSMTSDSELDANVIDDETVKSPDGVTVLKLARDFRIRKFVEMTGLSYDELDNMTFIDAADQLKVAAITESSILQNFDIQNSWYYITYVETIRQQIDPQEDNGQRNELFLGSTCALILLVAVFASHQATQDDDSDDSDDLTDGSDVAIEQPFTKATDWFLTEQEITDSRGGTPRNDLSVYTTGNAITSYTVPNEFFNAIFDDLSTVGDGQRVLITAWDSKLIPLKPDVDVTGVTTGYQAVFAGIVQRGGQVNILNWANLLRRENSLEVRDYINSLPPSPVNGARALFIYDDRMRALLSSHHQKSIVIALNTSSERDDHPVAYVGGLDLTNDRWDNIYHNNSVLRDAAGITLGYDGWIDGELRIHGPAAKDVANNFLARWNSDYKPSESLEDDMLNFENPAYDKLDPLDYASSTTKSKLGKQSVQIVRTFSCEYEHYKEFAPHGETSLFQARIKAIKNAKNYIYIEDQYFILVPELLDALLEVMPRLQKVIVVTNTPLGQILYTGYDRYFYDMVSPLKKKYPNKIQVYTTKVNLNIYIHSKIVIIDDVYLSIGSANWNRRSMTSDSELNANVVDESAIKSPDGITVNKLARDFRIRKFHEMTGESYDKLDAMTFLDAAAEFDVAAADDTSLLQTLSAKHSLYHYAYPSVVRQQVDPQDTCSFGPDT